MPSSGVRRTMIVLESNEPVADGREPNRVQVFFYGSAAVEAAGLNIGNVVAVEGRLGGHTKVDKAGMERAFPYLSGSRVAPVSTEEPQGFAFEARGKVALEPTFSETKGGTAHARVILERTYSSYLGPQAEKMEVNAFRTDAMTLAQTRPGQEVYVNGTVGSRTYETQDGQKRWTTDLFVREGGRPRRARTRHRQGQPEQGRPRGSSLRCGAGGAGITSPTWASSVIQQGPYFADMTAKSLTTAILGSLRVERKELLSIP